MGLDEEPAKEPEGGGDAPSDEKPADTPSEDKPAEGGGDAEKTD